MRMDYVIDPAKADPVWTDADRSRVDVTVFFPHLQGAVRYTAARVDPGWPHSEEIFADVATGRYGPVRDRS